MEVPVEAPAAAESRAAVPMASLSMVDVADKTVDSVVSISSSKVVAAPEGNIRFPGARK